MKYQLYTYDLDYLDNIKKYNATCTIIELKDPTDKPSIIQTLKRQNLFTYRQR